MLLGTRVAHERTGFALNHFKLTGKVGKYNCDAVVEGK